MASPPRILFSDCDTLRHTTTWPGSATDVNGWIQNPNFDDSSWNLIRNGAGNTGPDAPVPDGRVLNEWGTAPSVLGYNHWWSEIPNEGGVGVYEGHNYFRFTVDLSQDDLDNGVYLWAGCDYEGTVYCNGYHIGIPRTAWNFTSVCQVGTNVFAFEISDYAYPPPEPGYSYEAHEQAQDGLALDTWFWVHLQTGSTPIAPDCGACIELQETITDFDSPYYIYQYLDKGNGDYLIVTDEDIRRPDGSIWADPSAGGFVFGKTMVYLPDEDAVVYSVYTAPGTKLYKITEGGTPTLFGDNPGSGNYSAMSAEGVWQNPANGDLWTTSNTDLWFVWDAEGNWVAEYNNGSRPITIAPEVFSWAFDGQGNVYAGAYTGIYRARIEDWVATPNAPYPTSRTLDFEELLRYPLAGEGGIYGIAYHCGYVYFSHDDGELRRWPVDGTAADVEVIGGGGTIFPWGVTIVETNEDTLLFYVDYPSSRLHRMQICTTCESCWNWVDLGALPLDAEFGVVTTGNCVASSFTVAAVEYQGWGIPDGGAETVCVPGFSPTGVATDGVNIFIGSTDSLQGELYKTTFADPNSVTILASFEDGEHITYFNGFVYVAEFESSPSTIANGVYKVDPNTGAKTLFANCEPFVASYGPPYHLAFDQNTGHLYVTTLWHSVFEFDATGAYVTQHQHPGSSTTFYGISWSPVNGLLYMPNHGNGGQVITLDPTTGDFATVLSGIEATGTVYEGDDICAASNGRVYHADWNYDQIWSHDLYGGDIRIDYPFVGANRIGPQSLFEHDGWLYIADYSGQDRIARIPLCVDGDRKVFYSTDGDAYIHSASYPDLASTDTHVDGSFPYTYLLPYDGTITRYVYGMTLGPANELYVLVYRQQFGSSAGAEIWEFDTSNPNDTGTVVFYDPNDGGSNTGEMRGHIAYNPVDDRIYIAEWLGYWDGSQYFTSLASVDRTTWTRTNHVVFNNGFPMTTPPFMTESIAITPDGGVWFTVQNTTTFQTWMYRYDPITDTSASIELSNYSSKIDALSLPDNSVLFLEVADTYRITFNGSALTETLYSVADVDDDLGPYWLSSYGNGGPGEAWVFDGYNLWTYNTDCPAGCIGCWHVGMIGFPVL